MQNKLKEEIIANTFQNLLGVTAIRPVSSVITVNEYRDQEKNQDGQNNFSEVLLREQGRRRSKVEMPLEPMDGLNQYNNSAQEIYFVLSSKSDFRC